jgi:asparagine synthase (glutamine-hydrolysing)
MHQSGNNFLAHERLAIMDPASGDQPLFNEDRTISVTVNGEIYNYKELMAKILEKKPGLKFATQSDCEVRRMPPRFCMAGLTWTRAPRR